MDGVLVVNKPKNITSHDVVTRARRALNIRRIGHIGTLDPMATGVLPLVVGRATRLAPLLSCGDKIYDATILLGVVTDTYDVTGSVMSSVQDKNWRLSADDLSKIKAASEAFTGTFSQKPPPFSAKKIGGERAYRLARRKEPVKINAVEVTVRRFKILSLDGNRLHCRITCTPGFYMRALAHDLGKALGCGGCLESLRREQSGGFNLSSAVELDPIENEGIEAVRRLIPMANLLPNLPGVVVTERGARLAAHGNMLSLSNIDSTCGPAPAWHKRSGELRIQKVKVYDRAGSLLAVAESDPSNVLHPRIVLV